ncbi:CFEM domain-containing protein [Colletotrichum falcatum]|nr:CFEM domain-containing protein [Colletotrichum falcatum]
MVAARFFAPLACLLMLGSVAAASDSTPSVGFFPPCEAQCIFQEFHRSSCAIMDRTCICNDKVFTGYVQSCVVANCTAEDALIAKNRTDTLCALPETEHDIDIACVQVALFIFTALLIITRIAHKCMKISPWGWDDTTIMLAFVAFAAFTPAGFVAAKAGSGKNVWYFTPDQITQGLKTFFILTFLYISGLAFIKASILFLYLRIFPDQRFRTVLWLTQAFNLLLYLSFLAASLASCQPLSYAWEGWTGKVEGRCYSSNPPALAHGVLNFVMDIWMLLLPVSQVYKLNIPRRQKVDAIFMLSVGVFLTAASGYRIKVIRPFGSSFDPEVAFQTAVWSGIELAVGIFVACLPNTRQFWAVLLPKVLRAVGVSWRPGGRCARESTGTARPPGTAQSESSRAPRRSHGAVDNDASSTSDLVCADGGRRKSHQSDSVGVAAAPEEEVTSTMVARVRRLEMQLRAGGATGRDEEFDLLEHKR